jgi:hypothetical protein
MFEVIIALLWLLVDVFFVTTGALLIRLVSFKRWKAEPRQSSEHRVRSAAGSLSFRRDGNLVFTTQGQAVLGALVWLIVLLAALALGVLRF